MKTLSSLIIMSLIISCEGTISLSKPQGKLANSPNPDQISGLSFTRTTTSPSFEKRPSFSISGLSVGDDVNIFSDSSCSLALATPQTASGSSLTITPSLDIQTGLSTVYAQVSRGSSTTTCDELSVSYELLSCPSGYAHVPTGTQDFCVMQTEAKQDDEGYPSADPTRSPWANITADDASSACVSLNAKNSVSNKYDLISNKEWMLLSQNIETVQENWIHPTVPSENNIVGLGCMKQGNVGDIGDGCTYGDNSTVDYGSTRNSLAELKLSNGESVWDLSGNLWEMIDFDPLTSGFQTSPTGCDDWWSDIQIFSCPTLPESAWKPTNGISTGYWGLGKIYGGNAGVMVRSGAYYNGSRGGLYAIYLNTGLADADPSTGFRCVYRP